MLSKNDRKDVCVAVLIAVCVSIGFYLFYGNTGFIRSELDVLVYYMGCLVPFGLPVFVLVDKRHNDKVKEDIKCLNN